MIVSNHKRFIFVHIPKSAGMSVTQTLARYADLPTEDVFSNNRLKHETARVLRQVDANRFEKYVTFCFVRNPWDRAVSWYFYENKNQQGFRTVFPNFEDFVSYLDSAWEFIKLQQDHKIQRVMNDPYVIPLPQTDFVKDAGGQLMVDYVGRLENINEDFYQLMEVLDITAELPYVNKTAHNNYQEYYTDRTREIIGKRFLDEIDYWSYQYDNGSDPVLHRSERFMRLEDGKQKAENGDYAGAEKICLQILEGPLSHQASKILAQIHFKQGKYTECIERSLKVVEDDPEDMDGWMLILKSAEPLDNRTLFNKALTSLKIRAELALTSRTSESIRSFINKHG